MTTLFTWALLLLAIAPCALMILVALWELGRWTARTQAAPSCGWRN